MVPPELDPGVDVVLLEQDICGGGPSGRNGGFVNSFWGDLTMLCERFGDDAALRLCRAGEASVAEIGAFCEAQGFDAWFRPTATSGPPPSASQVGEWADAVITADRLGLDHLQVLTPEEVHARVDSPVLRGGVFSAYGATVHPARLARGLRNALVARRRPDLRAHPRRPASAPARRSSPRRPGAASPPAPGSSR